MNAIYTVNSLATEYAIRNARGQGPVNGAALRKPIYDFKVTGFNLFTIATIVTLATAILSASPLFLILGLLSLSVRREFMHDLDHTGAANMLHVEIAPNENRLPIAMYLGINDATWKPVAVHALCRLWMNWTPAAEVAQADAPNPRPANPAQANPIAANPVAANPLGIALAVNLPAAANRPNPNDIDNANGDFEMLAASQEFPPRR